jgi:HlyD family secretion protein
MQSTIENIKPISFKTKIFAGTKNIFLGKKKRRNIVVLIMFILLFSFVYYKYFYNSKEVSYEYAKVIRKDIKKTVEGSGKVVSLSELQIQQLQNTGKVTGVYVKPGDYVKSGQIIATLDNRQAAIQLAQAKATYDKIVNGGTKEELDISKQSVSNAKLSYEIIKQQQDSAVLTAKRNLLNTSILAMPLYDSRIQANSPTVTGSYICSEEDEYLIRFSQADYVTVTSKHFVGLVRISSVPQALGDCGLYLTFDSTKDYSNGEWRISLPSKMSSSYGVYLNAYLNAISAREQALLTASSSIVNAELALNQKVVGSRPEDIASAKASLANANLNYENTIIRAPFDGQIGAVSAAVGQQTNSQQGVATIITKDKIAQVSLNEIDVVNVKLGQTVELSFDAIPEEIFLGSVAEINTVGEVSSNVVTFAIKVSIPNADERIKSGMSVTANIVTSSKENILSIPSGTIKQEGKGNSAKFYVLKKVLNRNEKVYVSVGLTNDIETEVLTGLEPGEEVVSKTIDASSSNKNNQATFSLFGSGPRVPGSGGGTRSSTPSQNR